MTKIALITGAGTGIGRASALALEPMGYHCVLNGRNRDNLHQTQQMGSDARNFTVYDGDLALPATVGGLFAMVEEKFGRLDLLFNNAGIFSRAVPPDEFDFNDWLSVININLNAVFHCAQHAFRIMKKQNPKGGRIINNGSVSASTPRPFSAPYTASKHAITGLTKALSLDGRAHDICVCQIDIGNAATEMTEKMASGVLQADGSLKSEARMGVAQVARAVAFLASLPLDTNALRINIMANQMPFVGRG